MPRSLRPDPAECVDDIDGLSRRDECPWLPFGRDDIGRE